MARRLPPLAEAFGREIIRADGLVHSFEVARVLAAKSTDTKNFIHVSRVELAYELAFLRIFLAWEGFLEGTFVRFLCGYQNSSGQQRINEENIPGYYSTLADAEHGLLGGRDYMLWSNPTGVIRRSSRFFIDGTHELVISSHASRLEHIAAVRHRVVHSQSHAKEQFDAATMALCGRRYLGSRPGKFLRDRHWDSAGNLTRWFETISSELSGLARQIAS